MLLIIFLTLLIIFTTIGLVFYATDFGVPKKGISHLHVGRNFLKFGSHIQFKIDAVKQGCPLLAL